MEKRVFNISYRAQVESGEYGLQTREGCPARIICWNRENDSCPLVVLVKRDGWEEVWVYRNDGTVAHGSDEYDLFVLVPDGLEGLEEAAKEYAGGIVLREDALMCKQAFIEGAQLQKEQKPILEVFGFKVGDAVRLKDGDGRKHIIKSFEEVEGIHGPNFYHVEFEDDSARDGIYPGEEYPNGYYTQMEKFEKEQKPAEWSEDDEEHIGSLLARLEGMCKKGATFTKTRFAVSEDEDWLKSLRPQPQGVYKQIVHNILYMIDRYESLGYDVTSDKTCIPQIRAMCKTADECHEILDEPHWKPSEEQMKAFQNAVALTACDKELARLYNQLKKL